MILLHALRIPPLCTYAQAQPYTYEHTKVPKALFDMTSNCKQLCSVVQKHLHSGLNQNYGISRSKHDTAADCSASCECP